MRTRVLSLFFLLVSLLSGGALELGKGWTDPSPALEILEDPAPETTVDELVRPESRERFKQGMATHAGYGKTPLWTRLEVRNATGKRGEWVIFNPLPGMDEIDAWVFREDGRVDHHPLGDTRPIRLRELPGRYSTYPLSLAPGETALLLTRHLTTGSYQLMPRIATGKAYWHFYVFESIGYGLVTGMIAALALYNLMVFLSIRKPAFFYYVVFALLMGVYNLHLNGLVYEMDLASYAPYIDGMVRVLPSLALAANGLYLYHFLEMKSRFPRLRPVVSGAIAAAGLLAAFYVGAFFDSGVLGWSFLLAIFTAVWTVALLPLALLAFVRKVPGSRYLLLAQAGVVGVFIVHDLYISGMSGWSFLGAYSIPVSILWEMLFLSMALGQQIRRIEEERKKQKQELVVQSTFAGIGEMLGNVLHQWKQPLARMGSMVIRMETRLEHEGELKTEVAREIVAGMNRSMAFMNQTVEEFRNLYKQDGSVTPFRPAEVIETTLIQYVEPAESPVIRLEKEVDGSIEIAGYPHLFQHVLQNLIDNAVEILKERKTGNPRIRVRLRRGEAGKAVVVVEDNGGGIRCDPVEEIFTPFTTQKEQGGSGLGLAIAQAIVTRKMGGTIRAENTAEGARFTVVF